MCLITETFQSLSDSVVLFRLLLNHSTELHSSETCSALRSSPMGRFSFLVPFSAPKSLPQTYTSHRPQALPEAPHLHGSNTCSHSSIDYTALSFSPVYAFAIYLHISPSLIYFLSSICFYLLQPVCLQPLISATFPV